MIVEKYGTGCVGDGDAKTQLLKSYLAKCNIFLSLSLFLVPKNKKQDRVAQY